MRTNARALTALVAGGVLIAAGPTASYADDVTNNIDSTVDATYETIALNAGGTTQEVKLHIVGLDGDGRNGCNVNPSNKVTITLASSNTSVATVSPASHEFSGCGSANAKTFTVTSAAAGSANFTASGAATSRSGTMNYAPAAFKVDVTSPAPANTAPTVTVSGVTAGASYNKGSVPAATCDVVDAEDGNSSFAATLSSITGDYATDGIGSRTATCDYTDNGDLREIASATFSIVDPSAPTIGKTLDPADPDGLNGWYKSNASLTWSVTENESPNSLQKTGCENQNITADQAATPYTCSASSAGGSAAEQSVTIKRDGTAPSVSYTSAEGTEGTNGWYRSDVTATFTGTDATSGFGATGDRTKTGTASATGEGSNVSASSPAFTDHAGNTRAAGAASETFKIDSVAPSVSYTSASGTEGSNGWYTSAVTATFTGSDATSGFGADGSATKTDTASTTGEGSEVSVNSPAFTDHAGNTAETVSSPGFKVDLANPTASLTCPTSPVLFRSSAVAQWAGSDGTSGLVGDASRQVTLETSSVGTQTATGPAPQDNAGRTGTAPTCSYTVQYAASQILQPLNADGSSKVKLGSTVPVKVQLQGAGAGFDGAVITLTNAKVGSTGTGTELETLSTATPHSGNQLRWDAASGQYIFNLSTKNLSVGGWKITLDLGGELKRTVDYTIVK